MRADSRHASMGKRARKGGEHSAFSRYWRQFMSGQRAAIKRSARRRERRQANEFYGGMTDW